MGAVIAVDLNKLPAALRSNEQAVRRAIARGIAIGSVQGKAILMRATPVDQGQLKASWKIGARALDVPTGSNVLGKLYNDAPHAGVVELGARPHPVSPAGWIAIYEWVRRHPELYTAPPMAVRMRRARSGGRGASPWKPFWGPDPQIMAITNAIVWKLRTRGQRPTYFIRRNLDRVQRAVLQSIANELNRAAEETR